MQIMITCASVMTQEGHFIAGDKPNCSEALKQHLVEIGSAVALDVKIDTGYEVKKTAQFTQSLQQDNPLQPKTRKRRTRKVQS